MRRTDRESNGGAPRMVRTLSAVLVAFLMALPAPRHARAKSAVPTDATAPARQADEAQSPPGSPIGRRLQGGGTGLRTAYYLHDGSFTSVLDDVLDVPVRNRAYATRPGAYGAGFADSFVGGVLAAAVIGGIAAGISGEDRREAFYNWGLTTFLLYVPLSTYDAWSSVERRAVLRTDRDWLLSPSIEAPPRAGPSVVDSLTPPGVPPAATDPEEIAWAKAVQRGTRAAYRKYISEFSEGSHLDEALSGFVAWAVSAGATEEVVGLATDQTHPVTVRLALIEAVTGLDDAEDAGSVLYDIARPDPGDLPSSVTRAAVRSLWALGPDAFEHLAKLAKEAEESGTVPGSYGRDILDTIERALEQTPAAGATYEDLGIAMTREGAAKAEDVFLMAIEEDQSLLGARHNLAAFYFSRGEYEQALDQWRRLRALDPDFPDVDRNIQRVNQRLEEAAP